MPRGGAHFSTQELVRVLSHYDIGIVHEVKALDAGNRRAPKVIVTADEGKFILKRRPRGRDDLSRVEFAHKVQRQLAKKNFPLAKIKPTTDGNQTILQLDNLIYEFFIFVPGVRYDGSKQATTDAGRQLGRFHKYLSKLTNGNQFTDESFHDSTVVRIHLKTIGSSKRITTDRRMRSLSESLTIIYNSSSVRVNQLGFDSWQGHVVHGDWHPGNMLFVDKKVAAVVDFDGVRMAPTVIDLANGMLQFSIVAARPNPADWPDYFDLDKLTQFVAGYREVIELDTITIKSLVYLMVETMIAEAVLPIAATGFFGNLSGLDFLGMILRKATWLRKNRRQITKALL